MQHRATRRLAAIIVALALAVPSLCWSASYEVEELLVFAAKMASKGNWREARFRWEQALKLDPANPHVLNNLAAASEVLGEPQAARDLYAKALSLSRNDSRIADNAGRSSRFWEEAGRTVKDPKSGEDPVAAPPAGKPPRKGSETVNISVSLPLPARLDLTRMKNILVASFLANDSDLLDPNREVVRFLRAEFRKHTSLQVLDVNPPPAVPEQTVEDMIANRAFWSHLGHEFSADLLVSGVVRYGRKDASGFQDVDVVSSTTGQKVRETRFVEQEQFAFEIDVFFFDGGTGELLYRDRFQRTALFKGQSNDPITAFYDLSETIAGDVLSVVSARKREDSRVIFKS